jgi:sigma-B regulation protein RsbU (phosphoserine phosphatase)
MSTSRILVVDDDPGMLRAVERVLTGSYSVVGTTSPMDAVSAAEALNPDLAILDIRMPGLDGFELMARLKARLPDLDIILMTGSVDDLDDKLVRALRSPAFYFIQKPFDRDVLSTLVERCLELRWRREQNRRNVERLEKEIAEARTFQQSLLPDPEKVANGLAICCRYDPCARLGGDLYDYAAIESGRTALLIADVSGHGVSAAMLTGVVKSAFHVSRADGFDPLAVVHRIWRSLSEFSAERFVTLFVALVDPGERQLRYASAGHPAIPFWSGGRDPKWLDSTGPLISPVLPASSWEARAMPIDEGDQLLLYTDGVSETLAGSEDCGEPRIQSLIAKHAGGAQLLDAIVAAVRHDLAGRAQPDDLTLLTARVLPSGQVVTPTG